MRVVISAHQNFNDQVMMQQVMVRLKKVDRFATVVVGANKADRTAGLIWKAIGGNVIVEEPDWAGAKSRRQAMIDRDTRVMSHHNDLCISFEVKREMGWIGRKCKEAGVKIQSHDAVYQTVDAD